MTQPLRYFLLVLALLGGAIAIAVDRHVRLEGERDVIATALQIGLVTAGRRAVLARVERGDGAGPGSDHGKGQHRGYGHPAELSDAEESTRT